MRSLTLGIIGIGLTALACSSQPEVDDGAEDGAEIVTGDSADVVVSSTPELEPLAAYVGAARVEPEAGPLALLREEDGTRSVDLVLGAIFQTDATFDTLTSLLPLGATPSRSGYSYEVRGKRKGREEAQSFVFIGTSQVLVGCRTTECPRAERGPATDLAASARAIETVAVGPTSASVAWFSGSAGLVLSLRRRADRAAFRLPGASFTSVRATSGAGLEVMTDRGVVRAAWTLPATGIPRTVTLKTTAR